MTSSIQNTIEVKTEEFKVIQTKMNELEKTRIELRERGLMLLGAIDVLKEQLNIDQLTNQQQEETDAE